MDTVINPKEISPLEKILVQTNKGMQYFGVIRNQIKSATLVIPPPYSGSIVSSELREFNVDQFRIDERTALISVEFTVMDRMNSEDEFVKTKTVVIQEMLFRARFYI